jgi:hypothetical protein
MKNRFSVAAVSLCALFLGLGSLATSASDGIEPIKADGIYVSVSVTAGEADVAVTFRGARMEQSRGVSAYSKKAPLGTLLVLTAQATLAGAKATVTLEIVKGGKTDSKVSATGPNVVALAISEQQQASAF